MEDHLLHLPVVHQLAVELGYRTHHGGVVPDPSRNAAGQRHKADIGAKRRQDVPVEVTGANDVLAVVPASDCTGADRGRPGDGIHNVCRIRLTVHSAACPTLLRHLLPLKPGNKCRVEGRHDIGVRLLDRDSADRPLACSEVDIDPRASHGDGILGPFTQDARSLRRIKGCVSSSPRAALLSNP